MTLSIQKDVTLLAFSNGNDYCFYGTNAQKAAAVLQQHTEKTVKGIEYLMVPYKMQDIWEPRLVKAGYKIAILPA